MRSIFAFLLILLAVVTTCCSGESADSPKPVPASDAKTQKLPVKIERFEIKSDVIPPEQLDLARKFYQQYKEVEVVSPALALFNLNAALHCLRERNNVNPSYYLDLDYYQDFLAEGVNAEYIRSSLIPQTDLKAIQTAVKDPWECSLYLYSSRISRQINTFYIAILFDTIDLMIETNQDKKALLVLNKVSPIFLDQGSSGNPIHDMIRFSEFYMRLDDKIGAKNILDSGKAIVEKNSKLSTDQNFLELAFGYYNAGFSVEGIKLAKAHNIYLPDDLPAVNSSSSDRNYLGSADQIIVDSVSVGNFDKAIEAIESDDKLLMDPSNYNFIIFNLIKSNNKYTSVHLETIVLNQIKYRFATNQYIADNPVKYKLCCDSLWTFLVCKAESTSFKKVENLLKLAALLKKAGHQEQAGNLINEAKEIVSEFDYDLHKSDPAETSEKMEVNQYLDIADAFLGVEMNQEACHIADKIKGFFERTGEYFDYFYSLDQIINIYVKAGEIDKARDFISDVDAGRIKIDISGYQKLTRVARAFAVTGDYGRAKKALQEIRYDDKDRRFLDMLNASRQVSLQACANGDVKEALNILDIYRPKVPDYYTYAEISHYIKENKIPFELNAILDSEEKKHKGIDDKDMFLDDSIYLAKAYFDLGDIEKAKLIIDERLKSDSSLFPAKAESSFKRRIYMACLDMGFYNEAIRYLENHVTNHNRSELYSLIADTYAIQDNFSKSVEWLKKVEDQQYLEKPLMTIALDLIERGQFDDAVFYVQQAREAHRLIPPRETGDSSSYQVDNIYKPTIIKLSEAGQFTLALKISSLQRYFDQTEILGQIAVAMDKAGYTLCDEDRQYIRELSFTDPLFRKYDYSEVEQAVN